MHETQLLYLLMALSMGHPAADAPARSSATQTTRTVTPQNQSAPIRQISLRCTQAHDQKSRGAEGEACRMKPFESPQ